MPRTEVNLAESLIESSDDAIVTKTLDGIVTSWNPAAVRMFGYEAVDMIGQPMTRIFPQERMGEEPVILARIARGERVEHFETVRLKRDGTPINVSVTISPLRDRRGRIVGASKIVRDMTARAE